MTFSASSISSTNVFEELEARFLKYRDLASKDVIDCHEPMVDVETLGLMIDLKYSILPASSGTKLLLREIAAKKVVEAEQFLKETLPNHRLLLVYAYRSPAIQRAGFEDVKKMLKIEERNDIEAMEEAHRFIAVPEVAGHPTGGAIDLMIIDANQEPLSFGTPMHGMEKNSYVFSPYISDKAKQNRQLLRDIMMKAGFAPFDGEWWHFSYGDREWAAYYNEEHAIYDTLELEDVS